MRERGRGGGGARFGPPRTRYARAHPVSDAAPPARPRLARRLALGAGLLLVAIGAAVVLNGGGVGRLVGAGPAGEGAGAAEALDTPDDLLAWVQGHEGASLVVWDVAADSAVVAVRPDVRRPVAGLTGLLLAAELARRGGAGLDTATVLPASAVERRDLRGVEPERDRRPTSLADLARQALGADRAAADALLWVLGREATDALPARLGLDGLEAPLPLDGLLLTWAPADRPGPREAQLAEFLALGRSAQRDSTFSQSQAYVKSRAYRAAELVRLEQDGLGLSRDAQRAAARATFPRGTARAYARLLARAVRGDLASPGASDVFLDLVTRPAADSLRAGGGRRVGAVGGGFAGLLGAASAYEGGRGGRVAVLLLEGVPDAVLVHLAQTGLDTDLVLDLVVPGTAGVARPGFSGDP